MVSGATLGVEMLASAGACPSSVLGLVAQAPMVAVAVAAARFFGRWRRRSRRCLNVWRWLGSGGYGLHL